jgi:mannose-6-phosphate isomerase-like protein (cupin superfamily)
MAGKTKMRHINTNRHRGFFKPLLQSGNIQAAMMVLKAGQSSSEEVENEHPKAEQWLFVISGKGTARVGRRSILLKTGSLLLIEKKERHQVTNTGKRQMVTLNFYAPPAYTSLGDVKPAVATD